MCAPDDGEGGRARPAEGWDAVRCQCWDGAETYGTADEGARWPGADGAVGGEDSV